MKHHKVTERVSRWVPIWSCWGEKCL